MKPTGFREYDARWLYPGEINLMGVQALGLGIGTLVHELGVRPDIVTGHDFRSYSSAIKLALIAGMQAAGLRVKDIGLALSPMAYFGQFALDCPCVAMVTASHNDNGWTGVKMGANRPMTFGPEEMGRLKEIVLGGTYQYRDGGSYEFVEGFEETYLKDLKSRAKPITRKLKVVAACGNGTAGAFAPRLLEALGVEVVPLDVEPDYTFPRYNPNPEDMEMLHAIAAKVKENRRRCRPRLRRRRRPLRRGRQRGRGDLRRQDRRDARPRPRQAPPRLDLRRRCEVDRPVQHRSRAEGGRGQDRLLEDRPLYIKRRVNELGALAGFEKSGHFFFNEPIGRGYDDGC